MTALSDVQIMVLAFLVLLTVALVVSMVCQTVKDVRIAKHTGRDPRQDSAKTTENAS